MKRLLFAAAAGLFALVVLPLFPVPLAAAPDDTLGMALMSATVNENTPPTIVRGAGTVSANRAATGIVDVVFVRDLSNCTCTASVGYYANAGAYFSYFASANCPWADNTVRVRARSHDGIDSDVPFHLIVFCPK